jgi:hypothetical protein
MMQRIAGLGLGFALALGLSACTASEESAFGPRPLQVVVGVTTMDDVMGHLGPPENQVTDSDGLEVWTYRRTAEQALKEPNFMRAFNAGRPPMAAKSGPQDLVLIMKFQPSGVLDQINARQSSF